MIIAGKVSISSSVMTSRTASTISIISNVMATTSIISKSRVNGKDSKCEDYYHYYWLIMFAIDIRSTSSPSTTTGPDIVPI